MASETGGLNFAGEIAMREWLVTGNSERGEVAAPINGEERN
jgi:hypothetical protein